MRIIKDKVKLELGWEERQTLDKACEKLNKIADTLDKSNYHWLIFGETGEEINTGELRNIADTIEMFTYDSDIEIY